MPLLFWPLLAGTVGYVSGLFTGEKVGQTLRILIAVVMGLWLFDIVWGKNK
ncbi:MULTISPECIES: hypothetical protein [Photobacterium]|uniref:hypothetical protein n=1 Tax=Photobacterium TaxID=657 RepID=UPI001A8D61BB|nr:MULTISPECIES: hypothetical protein [Photobacterium]QSV17328.1 hypothetical protein FH974_20595 [Photobacterium ganghwense]